MIEVIENFINEDEEAYIMSNIQTNTPSKGVGRNSYVRYGSHIPYNTKVVSSELPQWSKGLIEKLEKMDIKCNSVSVNEYHKGQGIGPHIDSKSSGEKITVLSLAGNAVMRLTYNKEEKIINLSPRTLLIMSGDERWKWKHSIDPVKELRFSIVFRYGL